MEKKTKQRKLTKENWFMDKYGKWYRQEVLILDKI
jgi:hypothetical protein